MVLFQDRMWKYPLLNKRLCLYWIEKTYFLKTSLCHEEKNPHRSPPEYLHALFYVLKIRYVPYGNLDYLISCWITYVITSGKLKMVLIQNFDILVKNEFSVLQDIILYIENYIQEKRGFTYFAGLINLSLCLFDNDIRTCTHTFFLQVSYTIMIFGLDTCHWLSNT